MPCAMKNLIVNDGIFCPSHRIDLMARNQSNINATICQLITDTVHQYNIIILTPVALKL